MLKKFKFNLPEMMCGTCVDSVNNTLGTLAWQDPSSNKKITTTNLQVNMLRKTFEIEVDSEGVDDTVIKNFIIKLLADVGTVADQTPPHFLKALIGITSGAGFLLLSLFGGGLPIMAAYALTGVSTLLSFYVGQEIFVEAYKKVTRLRVLEMNALFSVSALVAISVSIAALFVPWLPAMLDAALLTFGFRHLGLAIENRARERVLDSVAFSERAPNKVLVEDMTGNFVERDVKEVKVGDIIRVNPEQIIPLDGKCLSTDVRLDVSIRDGSILSKAVAENFEISAGMKVKSVAPVDMKVTAVVGKSYLARLDEAILKAETEKAPLEETAQKILKYFVPALFIVSIATAGALGWFFGPMMAVKCAITLLVSACPCTLGSIVPLAVTVALEKAARENVLFTSGKALQAAAQTDTVIFDLNGTLTEGKYQVKAAEFLGAPDQQDYVYNCLAELEKNSQHPIAIIIREHLRSAKRSLNNFTLLAEPLNLPASHGKKMRINNEDFCVGNRKLMEEQGIDLTQYQLPADLQKNEQLVFFARGKAIVSYIVLTDPLKKDAAFVVRELKRQGKDVYICTGADGATALNYAGQLGIAQDHVFADALPLADDYTADTKTKSDYILELKNLGKTIAMIGDAGNDTEALKNSHLGIAVPSQAGADIIQTNADVIIQNQDLLKPLLVTFEVGNSMVKNINQNLKLSFTYNFVTFGLIACGVCCGGLFLNPALWVALMIGQAGVVLLNVYSFKQTPVFYRQSDTQLAASTRLNNTDLHASLGVSPQQTMRLGTQTVAATAQTSNVVLLQSTKPSATVTAPPIPRVGNYKK